MDDRRLLERAAELGIAYVESVPDLPVRPEATIDELREAFDAPLPEGPTDSLEVIEALARDAEPGLTQMASGRYFGFVIGGALPVTLAADWLTSVWDQNAGLALPTPAAAVVEEVAGRWLKELLGIPDQASFALVTGCQMAHWTALAAARHHVLEAAGYDGEADGLAGAPPIRVIAGAKRHGTIDRAVRFLGLGTNSIRLVPADAQGRMTTDALGEELAREPGPTIVCAQFGEVNTGSFDDLNAIADAVEGTGAWLHVDGAFGLWAAASPELRHLTAGVERADSWATDAHKWLNVPYDSGRRVLRPPGLAPRRARNPLRLPDALRRGARPRRLDARAFPAGPRLHDLRRRSARSAGPASPTSIERTCRRAREIADGIRDIPGCEILNDVVLNQVLLRFEDDDETDRVIAAIQDSGEAWLGGTVWDDRRAIRISVSNWQTSEDDVARAVTAFRAARSAATAR